MGKKKAPPPGTTRIEGTDGSIAFDGRSVTITHKWLASTGRGAAQFPLTTISGVNLKNGVVLAALTILVPGGGMPRRGKDPFTVNGFAKADAIMFRDLLVAARASLGATPTPTPEMELEPADAVPPLYEEPGLVDQLQQLAALHTQGMLTAEEFGIAKAKLLGTYASHDEPSQPW